MNVVMFCFRLNFNVLNWAISRAKSGDNTFKTLEGGVGWVSRVISSHYYPTLPTIPLVNSVLLSQMGA